MKTFKKQLEKIPDISEQGKKNVFAKAHELTQKQGASIILEDCSTDNIKLSVEFVNGKRAPKHELVDFTYKLFRNNIPEKYRITIKV